MRKTSAFSVVGFWFWQQSCGPILHVWCTGRPQGLRFVFSTVSAPSYGCVGYSRSAIIDSQHSAIRRRRSAIDIVGSSGDRGKARASRYSVLHFVWMMCSKCVHVGSSSPIGIWQWSHVRQYPVESKRFRVSRSCRSSSMFSLFSHQWCIGDPSTLFELFAVVGRSQ